MKKGKLFVLSGPSGSGIGDVIKGINEFRDDIGFVTPITSRKRKSGEVNGQGFYFYELDEWKKLSEEGELLESTTFAGNDYGTSKTLVEEQLNEGKNIIMSLEVERAKQIHNNMPEAILILIVKSSLNKLKEVFKQKGMSDIEISVRVNEARKIYNQSDFFTYIVLDDNISNAISEVNSIITAENCRMENRLEFIRF